MKPEENTIEVKDNNVASKITKEDEIVSKVLTSIAPGPNESPACSVARAIITLGLVGIAYCIATPTDDSKHNLMKMGTALGVLLFGCGIDNTKIGRIDTRDIANDLYNKCKEMTCSFVNKITSNKEVAALETSRQI